MRSVILSLLAFQLCGCDLNALKENAKGGTPSTTKQTATSMRSSTSNAGKSSSTARPLENLQFASLVKKNSSGSKLPPYSRFFAGTVFRKIRNDGDRQAIILDPGIRDAQDFGEKLGKDDEKLSLLFDRLGDALCEFDARTGQNETATFEAMQKAVYEMQIIGNYILNENNKLTRALNEYEARLKSAPSVYTKAAATYRKKADSFTDPEMKEMILEMATTCEALIVIVKRREGEIGKLRENIQPMMPSLKESVSFLSEVEQFLKLYPLPPKFDLDKQSGKIREYSNGFSRFKDLLKEFLRQIQDSAAPANAAIVPAPV